MNDALGHVAAWRCGVCRFFRKASGRHKYKAVRTETDGYSFASKLEAGLYGLLAKRVKDGELSQLKCQVEVRLSRAGIIYKPDFSAFEKAFDAVSYFEAKGFDTPAWQIKLKLFRTYGPGRLYVYKGSARCLTLHETIIPCGGTVNT